MGQDLTKLAVMLLSDDSTGYDEVDNCFATEVDTMVDIVCEFDLDND